MPSLRYPLLSVSHLLEIYICLIAPLPLIPLSPSTLCRLPCLFCSEIPLWQEPLPVLLIVCAPLSGPSGRLLRLQPVLHRPSALLRLSCSLHSRHGRDSLRGRNVFCLSDILHGLCLLLIPFPFLQGPCLCFRMQETLQALL